MATMDVRDLEARAAELVRRVRDRETIDVTEDGEVVARMTPVALERASERGSDSEAAEAWLRRADELAREIGARWPKGVSAVDAVRDVRRDL